MADLLIADGVPNVTSIDPEIDADGNLVYLSTEGVAEAQPWTRDRATFVFTDLAGRLLMIG